MAIVQSGVNTYRDSVTGKFIENNVKHFDGMGSALDNPQTPLPEETREALYRIGRTGSGHRAFNAAIESGDSVSLFNYMDSDFNSFLAWNNNDGTNEIIYTIDVQKYIDGNLQYSIPQRQLVSSTLGSLLSHEIGHTSFGGSLGEIGASSIFENNYRRTYGMPLVDGYHRETPNNVCEREGRC